MRIIKAMYNDKIMHHFMNPLNVGELDDADGIGEAGNPETGDVMRLYVKIKNDRITDAKHKTFGNAVAIAVSSIASSMIIGMTLEEAGQLTRQRVSDALGGIPPDKMDCSNMAPGAIAAAIADYRQKTASGKS